MKYLASREQNRVHIASPGGTAYTLCGQPGAGMVETDDMIWRLAGVKNLRCIACILKEDKAFKIAPPIKRDTKVEVLLQGDDKTFKKWLLVRVRSNTVAAMGERWCEGKVKVDDEPERVKFNVQARAEHLAVYQCQSYGDMHDPRQVGKAALAALEELQEQAEVARSGRGQG